MSILIAYRTAPQMERKAAQELRQAGIRACVPRDLSASKRNPTARGYVFARAAYSNAFAKHCKGKPIGRVTASELARLYIRRQRRRAEEACPYRLGQSVFVGEIKATVAEVRGRICIIETSMLGKTHRMSIHYAQLRPG